LICFGPVGILPTYQNRGVGSQLILETLQIAKRKGYRGVGILGDPAYYHRFGFVNAERFGITTSDGYNFDAFMVLELAPGSLDGIKGKYYYSSGFETDKNALELFDREFAPKEKCFVSNAK
jgi:predicted N-acetyltransferase YhbS